MYTDTSNSIHKNHNHVLDNKTHSLITKTIIADNDANFD